METADNLSTHLSLFFSPDASGANPPGWQGFVQRYAPLLKSWCRQMGLQDADAEDVTAVILAKLVNKMPTFKYDPAKGFRAYLRVVVRNAVNDFHKKSMLPGHRGSGDSDVREKIEQLAAPASVDSMAAELDAQLSDDVARAQKAIERVRATVDEKTWQAFWLTAVDGLDGAAVADRLKIKVANVYVYKNRVAKKLAGEVARGENL